MKEEKLTTELWELYNYLKEETVVKCRVLSVKDICDHFPKRYTLNAKQSNNTNCPKLYKDIDTLNNSYEIEKIIVKDNNRFYLGNEDECKEFADKLKARALRLLKKAWAIQYKIDNDSQGKIISCQNTPIDENSHARNFVETFVKGVEHND